MNFNQAQEVEFSRKLQKTNHNLIYFNHNHVQQVLSQKYIEMHLDARFNF